MKNVIFSIFIDLEVDKKYTTEVVQHSREKRVHRKNRFTEFYDKLVENKQWYADFCGADFRMYTEFAPIDGLSDYDSIQYYKLKLLEELAEEYDNVLYLDFDVIVDVGSWQTNFFTKFDMNTICAHGCLTHKYNELGMREMAKSTIENMDKDYLQWVMRGGRGYDKYNEDILKWGVVEPGKYTYRLTSDSDGIEELIDEKIDENYETFYKGLDKFHWLCKGETKKSMFYYNDVYKVSNHIINTGIVGGGSEVIKSIKFFDHFQEMCDIIQKNKEDELYPDFIREKFNPNNEVFFTYLLEMKKIPWTNLPQWWHYLVMENTPLVRSNLYHVINKNFEDVFNLF